MKIIRKKETLLLLFIFTLLALMGCSKDDEKDAKEVDALKKIIATQCENNASISEDIENHEQYTWSDGHLTEIKWGSDPGNKSYNLTGELSLSAFTHLTKVDCDNNKLTSLNLQGLTLLKHFEIHDNPKLTSVKLDDCTELKKCYIFDSPLTQLNVTNCTNLLLLYVSSSDNSHGKLKTFDLSTCPNLVSLTCINGELNELNLQNNPNLTELNCYNNNLKSLDLKTNEKLNTLNCHNNQLERLEVSPKCNFNEIRCDGNNLSATDVKKIIVPSPEIKKTLSSEEMKGRMDDYIRNVLATKHGWYEQAISHGSKARVSCSDYSKLSLDNGVRIEPSYQFFEEDGKIFTEIDITFLHPKNEIEKKMSTLTKQDFEEMGDSSIQDINNFSSEMDYSSDAHTLVSYSFQNEKGDCFKQKKDNYIEEGKNSKFEHFWARVNNYTQYKNNLNKVFSSKGKITITFNYKKGSYTYKLNKYQKGIMKLMLDFWNEGESYIK